ncbi:MAG: glycosyltransferase family 2 protein [Candidatus Thiodiazotropha sp. (ex Ctena orbiculata)]|uniref:Glycosyltransferase family 2 protein n=1 Tax=Candidatus Thiodiazotropha taylori TaxID=2792791 RepID=A0A944MDG0_9GAMM|nr:glycosyltransferase family 2 protein [Candidatus Thiodiazotropha taylori]MBV2135673.1 glycosyltransferase family 2 protein [Candidatus Thiodiazotropha taylori]
MNAVDDITYSIVIPVFNAEGTLTELVSGLTDHLTPTSKGYEILLVDDCSKDSSWDIIRELAAKYSVVRGFQLMRNSGQGAATMAGLAQSRGQLVVTMDDDLQNPPYEVPRLCKFMEQHEEFDVLIGRPREKRHALWRRAGSEMVNRMSNVMFEQASSFKLTSFRVIRREVLTPLLKLNVPEPAIGALLTTLTKRLINVDVDHAPRIAGGSGYSIRQLLKLTMSKFLGFSTFPLRFLAILGVVGISVSFLLGIYILFRYFFGDIAVPGWTTLSLLLIGLSGFLFLAFGIVGEYLQQILNIARLNPTYVIRSTEEEIINDEGDSEIVYGCNTDSNKIQQ